MAGGAHGQPPLSEKPRRGVGTVRAPHRRGGAAWPVGGYVRPTGAPPSPGQSPGARPPVFGSPFPVGAATRLDMVNAIASAVIAAGVKPSRGSVLPPTMDEGISLEVVAWVNNVAYDKSVWIEVCVSVPAGEKIHEAAVALEYQAPAGGGGDLFAARAPLPGLALRDGGAEAAVSYHLYYRVNDSLFTDGIVHAHRLDAASAFPAPRL